MQLPPLQVTRAVVQRYCRVLHRYADECGDRPLVLPNGQFFPDPFVGDLPSVVALVRRMQVHAGMDDVPIDVELVHPDRPTPTGSSCSSGACSVPQSASGIERMVDLGDSWLLRVSTRELKHPVALTTNLVRSLAFIFLVETQREGEVLEPPVDITADLVAVALGFGSLMLQGSYIYAKSCGGPQVASVTKIGVSELSVAVALFALLGQHNISSAVKELDITQRSLLSEAHVLLKANPALLKQIHNDPRAVSTQEFALSEPRGFLGRLFSNRKSSRPSRGIQLDAISSDMDLDEVESLLIDMPPASRAGRTRPASVQDPKKEELSALVADAFKEVGA